MAWGNVPSCMCEGWGNSSSKVSVQEWDREWSVFGRGRRLEILRGRHDWKVSVESSIRATWRERTLEGGRVCKPLYVRSCDKLWEEKTVIGNPKVRFFDSWISSVAAKVWIQGAHPWIVRSTFLTSILQVQKKVGDLRLQGQIPPFQLSRAKKEESDQGDVKLGP